MSELRRRPFRGPADATRMLALAAAHPAGVAHVVDLPYRLSTWALDEPGATALWEDDHGALLAWAVLQTPFWAIDYVVHPHAPAGTARAVLAWASDTADRLRDTPAGRPMWFVPCFASARAQRRDLEAAGYEPQHSGDDAWAQVVLRRAPLTATERPALAKGFTIRRLNGAADVPAYVALHREVFGTTNMTAAWRRRTLEAPGYRPELDLVAVGPDGRLAGFCVCWFSATGDGRPVGQIEPLGVHPADRRCGVARALVAAAAAALDALGAESLLVHTDDYRDAARAFYEALGFRLEERLIMYRRLCAAGAIADG